MLESDRKASLPTEVTFILFFQGNRDESYDVDEELAEQDATSLFEVLCFFEISFYNTFIAD